MCQDGSTVVLYRSTQSVQAIHVVSIASAANKGCKQGNATSAQGGQDVLRQAQHCMVCARISRPGNLPLNELGQGSNQGRVLLGGQP